MTDFYARLEEQLMTAARRQAERGPVARALAGRRPQLIAALAGAALLAGGVALLPGIVGPADSGPPASSRPVPPPTAPSADLTGIRVAVLNATTLAGVARTYADRLAQGGAEIGTVGSYHRQDAPVSRVAYRPGAAAPARRVAAALGVQRVSRADAADARIAADAQVVVIVGADAIARNGPRSP